MSVYKGLYTTGMIVDRQSDSQINDQKLWRKFPLHTISDAADMNQISDILFVCLTVNGYVMKEIHCLSSKQHISDNDKKSECSVEYWRYTMRNYLNP
jgi:hypothetical protein